jgi:hypothetical protein
MIDLPIRLGTLEEDMDGKIIVIALTTTIAGVAIAGPKLTHTKSRKTLDHDCGSNGVVAIMGSHNKITLRGTCDDVAVTGSNNTLTIAATNALRISGSSNTVDVVASNKIEATGNDNVVTYTRGVDGAEPKTSTVGKGNSIKPSKSAGSAPAESKPAPPASGNLKATKPIMCQRNDSITLENVIIETDGVAITTQGNCSLTVRNSKIVSSTTSAIQTMGSSMVEIQNTEVIGKWGSVMNAGSAMVKIDRSTLRGTFGVEGSSTVTLSNSHVHGARSIGKSSIYRDGGGNTFHKK